MLFQFNNDGTLSLLSYLDQHSHRTGVMPRSKPLSWPVEQSDVDAWIAEGFLEGTYTLYQ